MVGRLADAHARSLKKRPSRRNGRAACYVESHDTRKASLAERVDCRAHRAARVVPSLLAQALHLCAAAAAVSLVLGAVHGVPSPATGAPTEAGTTACTAPDQADGKSVRFISAVEARELAGAGNVAFVDCRPKEEFEAGHVAGSLHVDLATERSELPEAVANALRAASTVITYCDATLDCELSLRVASLLSDTGAADVRVLEGGLPAWLAEGYPAQSGACVECEAHP